MLTTFHIDAHNPESATEDCINARRNYILGLWAGKKLGLSEDALTSYVRDVMQADAKAPGADPVIAKVADDFSASQLAVPPAHILSELQQAERMARAEMLMTD